MTHLGVVHADALAVAEGRPDAGGEDERPHGAVSVCARLAVLLPRRTPQKRVRSQEFGRATDRERAAAGAVFFASVHVRAAGPVEDFEVR